ncbi:MAG: hypothetical protein AMXMBFR57_29800 [Acidimicrobiia bacterium]
MALSSAAIVAVYSTGLLRTRAAAEELDAADHERRPVIPAPPAGGESSAPPIIEPPDDFAPTPTATPAPALPVRAAEVKTPSPAPVSTQSTQAPQRPQNPSNPEPDEPRNPAPRTQHQEPAQAPTPVPVPASPIPTPVAAPPVEDTPAPAPVPPVPAPLMPKEKYRDGTYTGWGSSRHGDIQATVTIEGGRITAASISQCRTRYSCSWVAHLPPQIVARQSPECDYVTGATQSANAFYWGVVEALGKAK